MDTDISIVDKNIDGAPSTYDKLYPHIYIPAVTIRQRLINFHQLKKCKSSTYAGLLCAVVAITYYIGNNINTT